MSVPASGKSAVESFDGRILQAQAHLFEPEKMLAVGAGRDYEAEMRQLEARADALTALLAQYFLGKEPNSLEWGKIFMKHQ